MVYSDVCGLIDQYEVIPPDHAEAIVEALRRKGYRVTLGLRQVKLYSGPNLLHESLVPDGQPFTWEAVDPSQHPLLSARLSRVEII